MCRQVVVEWGNSVDYQCDLRLWVWAQAFAGEVMFLTKYLSSVSQRLTLWIRSNQASSLTNKSVYK